MLNDPESSSKSASAPNVIKNTNHAARLCRRQSRNAFSSGMCCLRNPQKDFQG